MSETRRPRPIADRILAEWRADPQASLREIARRTGASYSHVGAVTLAAGRPKCHPGTPGPRLQRRETAVQRKMRRRQLQREYSRRHYYRVVRPRRLAAGRRAARGALWARANSKVFTKN